LTAQCQKSKINDKESIVAKMLPPVTKPLTMSYKPVMTIISLRRKPPKTCRQKICAYCTIHFCGAVVIVSVVLIAAIGLEIQLQQTLALKFETVQQGPYWCGDWTPFGNIGNETYDPILRDQVDLAIPSCPSSKVGMNYVGKPSLLYCSPDLGAFNRTAAYLALDMRFINKQRPEYTIISQSRSLAELLIETAPMLCQYTVGAWEVVFVLDASIDDSLQVLHNVFTSPICLQSSLIRARVYVQPLAGMLETSSLNLAMTASRPSHFYIHAPPNVLIKEWGWNRDLARVTLEYNDIFSVSGQCGSSLIKSAQEVVDYRYTVGRCSEETQLDFASDEESMDAEHALYVTETNTRSGPLLWRADALRELGFLNEVNQFEHDNDELNRRAYLLRGWFSAFKYVKSHTVKYEILANELDADDSWMDRHVWKYFHSSSKVDPKVVSSSSTIHLPETAQLALKNYRRFRSKCPKTTCGSTADDTSAYFHPYHTRAEKRQLAMEFDADDPLPPLPAML
jgi:hypothetical protein